jgi:hypothetical protein
MLGAQRPKGRKNPRKCPDNARKFGFNPKTVENPTYPTCYPTSFLNLVCQFLTKYVGIVEFVDTLTRY